MAIQSKITVTVLNNSAKNLEVPLFFIGDGDVEIYLELKNHKVKFQPSYRSRNNTLEFAKVDLTILSPSMQKFEVLNLEIIEDYIKFLLPHSYISEVGTYKLYIHLKDNGTARKTLPIIDFYEVQELLGGTTTPPSDLMFLITELGELLVTENEEGLECHLE